MNDEVEVQRRVDYLYVGLCRAQEPRLHEDQQECEAHATHGRRGSAGLLERVMECELRAHRSG